MHTECLAWLKRVVPKDRADLDVLEIGSRDVNGSPRALFPLAVAAGRYVGVDIAPGPGVDVVADAAEWRPSLSPAFDVVICVEVLEHAARWREIVQTCADCAALGGIVLLTAAGPKRAPHSAVDGLLVRRGEHYANVERGQLEAAMREAGLRALSVTLDRGGEDVRGVGFR